MALTFGPVGVSRHKIRIASRQKLFRPPQVPTLIAMGSIPDGPFLETSHSECVAAQVLTINKKGA